MMSKVYTISCGVGNQELNALFFTCFFLSFFPPCSLIFLYVSLFLVLIFTHTYIHQD